MNRALALALLLSLSACGQQDPAARLAEAKAAFAAEDYVAARTALHPDLSLSTPAARYGVPARA